jgi:hypothetical protein
MEHNFHPALAHACVVNALPISEASVEKLFSSLEFLLSDQKSHTGDAIVDEILFLHTNNLNFFRFLV